MWTDTQGFEILCVNRIGPTRVNACRGWLASICMLDQGEAGEARASIVSFYYENVKKAKRYNKR